MVTKFRSEARQADTENPNERVHVSQTDTKFLNQAKKLSDKVFSDLLKGISSHNKDLNERIQAAAWQGFLYAFGHNDYDKASKLMLILRDEISQRHFSQVRKWFEMFGPFGWRKTEDVNFAALGGFKFRKSSSENASVFNPEEASKTNWYDLKPEASEEEETTKAIEPVLFIKRIDKLVRDIDKALKEHLLVDEKKNAKEMQELADELYKLLQKYAPEEVKTKAAALRQKKPAVKYAK